MAESIQITALVWRQQATIPYADFPVLLAAFLNQNPSTPEVEELGLALRESDPMKWDDLVTFMKKVGEWAGQTGPRVVLGQVLKGNPIEIESKVRDAIAQLRLDKPDPVAEERWMRLRALTLRLPRSTCVCYFRSIVRFWIRFSRVG